MTKTTTQELCPKCNSMTMHVEGETCDFQECVNCGERFMFELHEAKSHHSQDPPAYSDRSGAIVKDGGSTFRVQDKLVLLELAGESRARTLGHLRNIQGVSIFIKEEGYREDALHRKTQSFGLPTALLNLFERYTVRGVAVKWRGYFYYASTATWLEQGQILYFKSRSERRNYLPIAQMAKIHGVHNLISHVAETG